MKKGVMCLKPLKKLMSGCIRIKGKIRTVADDKGREKSQEIPELVINEFIDSLVSALLGTEKRNYGTNFT
jgi:hypothetical protein